MPNLLAVSQGRWFASRTWPSPLFAGETQTGHRLWKNGRGLRTKTRCKLFLVNALRLLKEIPGFVIIRNGKHTLQGVQCSM